MAEYLIKDSVLCWLETILDERFGQALKLSKCSVGFKLQLDECVGSILFDAPQACFARAQSDLPLTQWDVAREGWQYVLASAIPAPGVSELPFPLIERLGLDHIVHYDILGLTYWMLSRQEEVGRTDLDEHGRFPATSSHAYKHGYLDRPIVDEWLHILGQIIERTWPGIKLKRHTFSMKVSHDVDSPSRYGFQPWPKIARAMMGHVIKRRDFKSALYAPLVKLNTKTTLHRLDPANTFDWIMNQSENHGLTSAFYFICGRTNASKDADYEIEHPAIRDLMWQIHKRGHEIGLHPSYNTYQRPESIIEEAKRLRSVTDQEGIQQKQWGGRMHYLRWEHPTTMRGWEDAGMHYDSTLSYADLPGFRCGTCFEYLAIDPVTGNMLNLRIRPLIAMECTVMATGYMGLGSGKAAAAKFEQLKDTCRAVNGCFMFLWHNTEFSTLAERELYQHVLKH
jgi:hypothetical protein